MKTLKNNLSTTKNTTSSASGFTNVKNADPKGKDRFLDDEEDDDYDVPLDDVGGLDDFNSFDDDDEY